MVHACYQSTVFCGLRNARPGRVILDHRSDPYNADTSRKARSACPACHRRRCVRVRAPQVPRAIHDERVGCAESLRDGVHLTATLLDEADEVFLVRRGHARAAEPEPPAPVGTGFSLRGAAQDEVVAAYANQRTHHALEAHRFFTGEWPESLDQVSRGGLLAGAVLAAPDASSYYYAKRDGGVLLLAPAR